MMSNRDRVRSFDGETAQTLLSRNLSQWRREHGLLLKQMAPDLGVSVPTLDAWERGRRFPTGEHLTVLSGYMGVPVCRLFCFPPGGCSLGSTDGVTPSRPAVAGIS